jgi:hypothetical protein
MKKFDVKKGQENSLHVVDASGLYDVGIYLTRWRYKNETSFEEQLDKITSNRVPMSISFERKYGGTTFVTSFDRETLFRMSEFIIECLKATY